MREKIRMHERNRNKMQRGAGNNMGCKNKRKANWAKKDKEARWALWAGFRPVHTGSDEEPVRPPL